MIRTRVTRHGTVLLICIAIMTAMVALAFTFVSTMRSGADLAASTRARQLSQETARAGVSQAVELLVRDYLDRPEAVTSDASPHRLCFGSIDNVTTANPNADLFNSTTSNQFNDNDVSPTASLLNGYRNLWSHMSRGFLTDYDKLWRNGFTASNTPRYVEAMYWRTNLANESGANRIDVTTVPAIAPDINTPIYYDARWQTVTTRSDARYRLRHATMVEDLSGHLLLGKQAAFSRGDPLAIDGTLAANRRDQGEELDRANGYAYAPAAAGFLATHAEAEQRGITVSSGPVHLIQCMIGYGSGNGGGHHRGFSASGTLLGMSPWSTLATTTLVGTFETNAGLPNHPINMSYADVQNSQFAGKRYSWLSLAGFAQVETYGVPSAATPYQAGWDWTNAPHPGTGSYATEPFNRGPTDCPWRINPLTAPFKTLSPMFTAWRPNPCWNGNYTHAVFYDWISGTTKINAVYSPNIAVNTVAMPALPTTPPNRNMPNPFRDSFTTRLAGTTTSVAPFGQFVVSPSAINPRERTDPYYPSPMAWGSYVTCNELGRFSDIHKSGSVVFGRARNGGAPWASVGVGDPRITTTRRRFVSTGWTGWVWPNGLQGQAGNGAGYANATDSITLANKDTYSLFSVDPFDRDNSGNPTGTRLMMDEEFNEYAGNSYFYDAQVALVAATIVAIAAHQPTSTFPVAPPATGVPGGLASLVNNASWGQPSLDTDIDGDGYQESCSAFRNVADLDRMFLLILGENPDAPGAKGADVRQALIATQKGSTGSGETTATSNSYVPLITTLPIYDTTIADFNESTDLASQSPYQNTNNALMINLRRNPLRRIRETMFDNDPTHASDSTYFKTQAASYVRTNPPYPDARTVAKHQQLKRCQLRDAERMINDMRMSFFGANPRYADRNMGKFKPYDLDGDGWAICSAYVPCTTGYDLRVVKDENLPLPRYTSYRFTEPRDWSKVVYDDTPENPLRVNNVLGTTLANITTPVLVCFRDIDPATINLTENSTTSDFTDFNTYTGVSTTNTWDTNTFPGSVIQRDGYTRWFYPASRVTAATDADMGDVTGVASEWPDTYFSMTGAFTLEKSRFYRIITRGEVWDEWRKATIAQSTLESVLMIDPDGDVYSRAGNVVNHRIVDATGMDDTNIVFQRWLTDLSMAGNDRPYGDR